MHWPQVLKRFGQGPSTPNINLKMHLMLTQTLMFWNVKLFAYSNKHFPDFKKKLHLKCTSNHMSRTTVMHVDTRQHSYLTLQKIRRMHRSKWDIGL